MRGLHFVHGGVVDAGLALVHGGVVDAVVGELVQQRSEVPQHIRQRVDVPQGEWEELQQNEIPLDGKIRQVLRVEVWP